MIVVTVPERELYGETITLRDAAAFVVENTAAADVTFVVCTLGPGDRLGSGTGSLDPSCASTQPVNNQTMTPSDYEDRR